MEQYITEKVALEEIKKALCKEKNSNPDQISVYSIANFMGNTEDELKRSTNSIKEEIKRIINDINKSDYKIHTYFDYNNKQLCLIISYRSKYLNKVTEEEISFIKIDDDLQVLDNSSAYNDYKLSSVEELLLKQYNQFMKWYDFHQEGSYGIKVDDTKFEADVYRDCVNIHMPSFPFGPANRAEYLRPGLEEKRLFQLSYLLNSWASLNKFQKEEEILKSTNLRELDKWKYLNKMINNKVNFKWIASRCPNMFIPLKGKETKILDSLYVNISDCPEWCQEQMREIRKKQLEKPELEKTGTPKTLFELDKMIENNEKFSENLEKTAHEYLGESPEYFISKQDLYTVPNSKQTEPVSQKSLVRKLKDRFRKDNK